MSKMWTGPSEDYRLALTDPVAVRLHRRAGEQGIAYNIANNGRSAEVFRMVKVRDGLWNLPVLGTVEGDDAIHCCINAALEYTEHDPELFSLIARDIDRRTTEILSGIHGAIKRVTGIADTLEDAMAPIRSRYV